MATSENQNQSHQSIPVVGVGASAGGVAQLKKLFKHLPDKTGLAFVVVIHLSPDYKSNLAQLLQMKTSLKVSQVEGRQRMHRNHVYVIPPKKNLLVTDNHLELTEPEKKHSVSSINHLFYSMAEVKKRQAACVILSGSGDDGALGLKAVKEKGGITFVQKPDEASYPAMPLSAIDTGAVDMVLPVREIAEKLVALAENLSKQPVKKDGAELQDDEKKALRQILSYIQNHTGHDFSNYKRAFILRRIDRRMRVNQKMNLDDYLAFLKDTPKENDALLKDIFISVTNFFRDADAFKALEEQVVPQLFERAAKGQQMRVWVPGCATGEEAYSIAITLLEHSRRLDHTPKIKIFATDIDAGALEVARRGVYPASIDSQFSKARLRRFFNETEHEYQVKKQVREMILFAPHDLLRDPPFSRLDFIACRNVLIYLNRDLQAKVFNLLHYALRDEGYLFLGSSDSKLEAGKLFTNVDKKFNIYRQMPSIHSTLPLSNMSLLYQTDYTEPSPTRRTRTQRKDRFGKLHRALLNRMYAPQSVIINKSYEVIHATDGIDKFLSYTGGLPSQDVMEMIRPEIRQALRSLLFQLSKNERRSQQKAFVRLDDDQRVELITQRIQEDLDYEEGLILVVFKEQMGAKGDSDGDPSAVEIDGEAQQQINEKLEEELKDTREQLQVTVEEYETSNEELRASNEELQSMNEELQSTTEELETSKEELQSVNEEMRVVNDERGYKLEKLNRANSDLKNLMDATRVGIIFVDCQFNIQRFTSEATEIFNLISSDINRPLEHVTNNLEHEEVMSDIKHVLDSLDSLKKVVTSTTGRTYIMRMDPYRSVENRIDGVVLTFIEITQQRKDAEKIKKNKERQQVLANLGIYALEQMDPDKVMQRISKKIFELLQLDWVLLLQIETGDEGPQLKNAACTGPDLEPGNTVATNKNWDVGHAYYQGEMVKVEDYSTDDRFSLSPLVADRPVKSGVIIPTGESKPAIGLLAVYFDHPQTVSANDVDFLQIAANIVGTTIERVQALNNLKESNDKLQAQIQKSKKLQREILNNSLAERWELGSYLHDNLAQMLASAQIIVKDIGNMAERDGDVGQEAAQLDEILSEIMIDLRNITQDIVPIDIEKEGVAKAYRSLIKQTNNLYNIHCIMETTDIIDQIKNKNAATHLYHIIQEGIKNADVHGQAQNVTVSIYSDDDQFVLEITDDGRGLQKSLDDDEGRGLRIINHRMDLLGGSFRIDEYSEDGRQGTKVRCTLPLQLLMKRDET